MSKTIAAWMAIGIAWLAAAFIILPIAAVVGVCWIVYTAWLVWWRSPGARRWKARRRATLLFDRACAIHQDAALPQAEQFAAAVTAAMDGPSAQSMRDCARGIYDAEGFTSVPQPPPADAGELALARYCDRVSRLVAKVSDPDTVGSVQETLRESFLALQVRLPRQSTTETQIAADRLCVSVRAMDAVADVPAVVAGLIAPFYRDRVMASGLFGGLREQLDRNQHNMSGVPFTPLTINSSDLIPPTKHRGTSEEIVRG